MKENNTIPIPESRELLHHPLGIIEPIRITQKKLVGGMAITAKTRIWKYKRKDNRRTPD